MLPRLDLHADARGQLRIRGQSSAKTQLRRYEIEDGQMEAFLPYWRKLNEQRQKFGFRVVFAYVDETNNEVVWAVEHDGDFEAADGSCAIPASPQAGGSALGASPPLLTIAP